MSLPVTELELIVLQSINRYLGAYGGFRRLMATVVATLCCCLLLVVGWVAPGQARLDYEQEAGGQMLYRSFQSLRDLDGHPWQAIAFKRVFADGQSTFFLRLVGFPETATVVRQQALVMTNVSGQTFEAPDSSDRVFTDNGVPDSVGQYDIAAIVLQLSVVTPLKLQVPTADGAVTIAVPPTAIAEWQTVANE